ncbi:MAG: hypothetical protein KJP14_11210 [Eudoraea sp.]|nr:hypothetical protein [Eudoraea sp.]MBT8211083.1 hypothetical protein [Eudoraea sp.]
MKTQQNIQLVDGEFTPSEASDVILSLIEQKINFHKLQRLALCEGHYGADTEYPDDRIGELEMERAIARDFISQVRYQGKKLKINGILEISLVD